MGVGGAGVGIALGSVVSTGGEGAGMSIGTGSGLGVVVGGRLDAGVSAGCRVQLALRRSTNISRDSANFSILNTNHERTENLEIIKRTLTPLEEL